MRVEWSERALERVDEIADFLAARDHEAAVRWATKLFVAVETLAELPGRGRIAPEFGDPSIREILFGSYRVIYQVGSIVEILTVRHCAQGFEWSNPRDSCP